jgi:hypothetical protein
MNYSMDCISRDTSRMEFRLLRRFCDGNVSLINPITLTRYREKAGSGLSVYIPGTPPVPG